MPPADISNPEAESLRFARRAGAMALAMLLAFGMLAVRLYVLQVQRHDDLADRAESNRTSIVAQVPVRGQILDRNGVVLATNHSTYTLEITPERVPRGQLDATIDALAHIVDISARERRRFKRLLEDSPRYAALPIRNSLSDVEMARFAAQRWRFPGVDIQARLLRSYPMRDSASHVIGYVARISPQEKERLDASHEAANYRGTEVIGKLGIEQSYETELHGQTGWQELEISAGGHAVRLLGSRAATPGRSLVLSLDIGLQRLAEQLYGARRGALVAIDPGNGEVLAMVSRPGFDLNLFVDGIDQESWAQLNDSPQRPLLHRALRGTYPPGSTYKPFMALAALESGKRTPQTTIMDSGSWTFGGNTFRSTHPNGPTDLHKSLVKSSNVYYYTLANDMGVNLIHEHMQPLGLGQITGIDLRGEARGVLPSTAWKQRAFENQGAAQQKWYAGETISLGIGQGYNNFTILQLAHATATLAAGGIKHRPHLALGWADAASGQFTPLPRPPGHDLGYRPEHVQAVHAALAAVPLEGTARGVFASAPYTSAGKTGTAQAVGVRQNERYNAARLGEFQRDHSLYIAWAPAENPRIALAAIVENVGFGAAAAAPLARRVFDYWLLGHYPSAQDLAAVQQGRATAPLGTPRRAADMQPGAEHIPLAGPVR